MAEKFDVVYGVVMAEDCYGAEMVRVFEGAIDLLSYATVRQRHSLKWNEENLLSMGGISVSKTGRKPIAIKRFLEENAHIDTIHIHFDKDAPGIRAAESLKNALDSSYQATVSPPPYGKDYNDYLLTARHLISLER